MRLFQTLLWIVFQCKSIQLPQCSVSNYSHGAFHLCLKFSCPSLSSRCNSYLFSSVLLTSLSLRSLQRASKDFKGPNMSCLFVHTLKISDLIHRLFTHLLRLNIYEIIWPPSKYQEFPDLIKDIAFQCIASMCLNKRWVLSNIYFFVFNLDTSHMIQTWLDRRRRGQEMRNPDLNIHHSTWWDSVSKLFGSLPGLEVGWQRMALAGRRFDEAIFVVGKLTNPWQIQGICHPSESMIWSQDIKIHNGIFVPLK